MIVCHTVGNWGFYSIINMMPKFMGNYQQYDVKQIGWMSAIPYLLQTVTVLGATWFSDFLRVSSSFIRAAILKPMLLLCNKINLEQIWLQKSLYSKIFRAIGDNISSNFSVNIKSKWMQLQNNNCFGNSQSVFLCIQYCWCQGPFRYCKELLRVIV